MENIQIGAFIRDRRLQLELTQQQLADRLGITDKAVSKWERSVSYPDITLLRELADALEVSVDQLLAGEPGARGEPSFPPPAAEDAPAGAVRKRRKMGWRFWTFLPLTAACAIAVLTLLIIHWTVRDRGTLLAAQCVAIGWAVCYPLLRTEDHPVRNAMVVATAAVYPLVWLCGGRQAFQLGVVIVSVAYAWAVYGVCRRYRRSAKKAAVLIGLLGALLHVSVNYLVRCYGLDRVLLVTGAALAAGAGCLLAARMVESLSARAAAGE